MERVIPRVVCAVVAGVVSLAGPTGASAQFADSRTVPVIIRDVVAGTQTPPSGTARHPDFGGPATGLVTGEVLPTVGLNPVTLLGAITPSPSATSFGVDTFETWFSNSAYNTSVDGSSPVVHTFTDDLTMTHLGSGLYQFKSAAFDPLNGRGFGNVPGTGRNAHFTVEGHWQFAYHEVLQPTMRACADDSLWIFINGRLVVDLGGVRGLECRVVNLTTLGLTNFQTYTFDMFYADRSGLVSALELTTNLDLFVPWRDEVPPIAGLSAITLEADRPSGADVQSTTLGALDVVTLARPTFTVCLEPFGAHPVGTHEFHCTAADGWGNQTSFVSVVMVQDSQAPILTAVPDIFVQATGDTTSVTWNGPAASDVVTINPIVSCLPSSGSLFAVGTTSVSCTAVDEAGNLGSTTFTVNVAPPPPPPPPVPTDSDGDGVADDNDAFVHSNLAAYVSVGSCSTRVVNRLLPSGATFNDLIAAALSGARRHGEGVSAVTALAKVWQRAGLITGRDHGMIVSCAARNGPPSH